MLKFVKGYLENRTQRVVINNKHSKILPVNSGVPQDSVLGPLLFTLFINDIYENVSEGTNIALYADDTKIWRKITSIEDCIILNRDIDTLHSWAKGNGMKFHPQKCKVLTVSLRRQIYNVLSFDRFSCELGDDTLDYVSEEKDLGIIVTNKLNWEQQQNYVISKASRQLGLLMRTCHFIRNKYQKRSLFITLVRSIFEHCGEVWVPNYVVAEKKIEPIQKRAVKWIYGELNKKYNPEEYLQKLFSLDLLPIFNFFCLKKLKVSYKVKNELSHISMPFYIQAHRATRNLTYENSLGVSDQIQQPLINPFRGSFFPSSTDLWNALPDRIRNEPIQHHFIKDTVKHMWNTLMAQHDLEPD